MAECAEDLYEINYTSQGYETKTISSANGAGPLVDQQDEISADPLYNLWPDLSPWALNSMMGGSAGILPDISIISDNYANLTNYFNEVTNIPTFQTESQCSFEDTNGISFSTDTHTCYLNGMCDTNEEPALKKYDYTCYQNEQPIFEWMNYKSRCDTWDFCPDNDDNYSCITYEPDFTDNSGTIQCAPGYISVNSEIYGGDWSCNNSIISFENNITLPSAAAATLGVDEITPKWSGQCRPNTCEALSIHNSDREFDVVVDDISGDGGQDVRCNDGYSFAHGNYHQGGKVSCETSPEGDGDSDWYIYDNYLDNICKVEGAIQPTEDYCKNIRIPEHIYETYNYLECSEYDDMMTCPPKHCYWNNNPIDAPNGGQRCEEKHIGCQWIPTLNECGFRVNVSDNDDYPICTPQYCPTKSVPYSNRISSPGFHPLPGPLEGHHSGKCVLYDDAINARQHSSDNVQVYSDGTEIDSAEDCMCFQHNSCSTCNEGKNCQWCTGEGDDEQNGVCMSIHTSEPMCNTSIRQIGPGSCTHQDGTQKEPWYPMNELGCEEPHCKDKHGTDVGDMLLYQLNPTDPSTRETCMSQNNQWNIHPVSNNNPGVCHYTNMYNKNQIADTKFYPMGDISENISIREKICKSNSDTTDETCSTNSDITNCLSNPNCEWAENPIKQSSFRWTDEFNYKDVISFTNHNMGSVNTCKRCSNDEGSIYITDKECSEISGSYTGDNISNSNDVYVININNDNTLSFSQIENNNTYPYTTIGGNILFDINDIDSPCRISTHADQRYYGVTGDPIELDIINYNTNITECQYLANDDSVGVGNVDENAWCLNGTISCDPESSTLIDGENICLNGGTFDGVNCINSTWPGCDNPRCSKNSDIYSNCFIPQSELNVGGANESENCQAKNLSFTIQEIQDGWSKYSGSEHNTINCSLNMDQNYISGLNGSSACNFIGNDDDDVYYSKICINPIIMEYASFKEACENRGNRYDYDNEDNDWKCYNDNGVEIDSGEICREEYDVGDNAWTISEFNKCLLDSNSRSESQLSSQCTNLDEHKIKFKYTINNETSDAAIIREGACENTGGGFPEGKCDFDNTLCSDINTLSECTRDNFTYYTDYTFSDESHCDTSLSFDPDIYYHWTGGTIHGGDGDNWESDCSSTLLSSCNIQCDNGYGGGGDYVCHYNNDSENICDTINNQDEFKNSYDIETQANICERHLNCTYSIEDEYDLSTAECIITPNECNGFDMQTCNSMSECKWNEIDSKCDIKFPIRGNLEWIGSDCYRLDNTSFSHGISELPAVDDFLKPFIRVFIALVVILCFILILGKFGVLKAFVKVILISIRKIIIGFATGITNLFRDLLLGTIYSGKFMIKRAINLTQSSLSLGTLMLNNNILTTIIIILFSVSAIGGGIYLFMNKDN